MKTKVIDIRKHDPEKVVAYWVSQGGINRGLGRDKKDFPYVGIHGNETITGWKELDNDIELIDLPESQDYPEEEFNTGDRILHVDSDEGTFIGEVEGKYYYLLDGFKSVFQSMASKGLIKHYKEPEVFEGWVSQFCNVVFESWAQAHEACSDARVFKVREVKDEG
jgi:hypothetical protein